MSEVLAPALIGLIGVAVGATLQAWLSYSIGQRELVRKERFDAYQAFWSALSRDFTDQRFEWASVRKDEALRKACFEVSIYGSKPVIVALAALIEGNGVRHAHFDQLRLYEVIRAMRKDLSRISDRGIKTDLMVTMSAGNLENFFEHRSQNREES